MRSSFLLFLAGLAVAANALQIVDENDKEVQEENEPIEEDLPEITEKDLDLDTILPDDRTAEQKEADQKEMEQMMEGSDEAELASQEHLKELGVDELVTETDDAEFKSYSDPNHRRCQRAVRFDAGGEKVRIIGADGSGDGGHCDVEGVDSFTNTFIFEGTRDGEQISVDFSPKGGPANLKGKVTKDGIEWQDGNKWTELPKAEEPPEETDWGDEKVTEPVAEIADDAVDLSQPMSASVDPIDDLEDIVEFDEGAEDDGAAQEPGDPMAVIVDIPEGEGVVQGNGDEAMPEDPVVEGDENEGADAEGYFDHTQDDLPPFDEDGSQIEYTENEGTNQDEAEEDYTPLMTPDEILREAGIPEEEIPTEEEALKIGQQY